MKVSIIIPCYNASIYVDKCLNSILSDKLKDIEIILINDGSTDDTLKMLQNYEKKYKNIKVINEKNSGQAVARNAGLSIAKGEYISFVDIDDYVQKNIFYKLYNFAKKGNYDYVYCDYIEHYSDKDIVVTNNHSNDPDKNKVLVNYAPWGKLFKRELLLNNNFKFLEGKIFEDIAVIPYTGALSINPGYFQEALYIYNQSNISTTRQKKYNSKFKDYFYVSDYIYNSFKNSNLLDKYYEEVQFIFLDSILKTGVIQFSRYKELINDIKFLRKNVLDKFPKLLNNKYYKKESLYHRIIILLTIYTPPKILYFLRKVKK